MKEEAAIATEGGHWYDAKTGEPRYTIIGKNGKERPTNIKDARENGYVPSVNTITQILDKPFLTQWKMSNVALASLTLPKREDETTELFLKRIVEDAKTISYNAMDLGTQVHTAIERFTEGKEVDKKYETYCISAVAAAEKEIPGFSLDTSEKEKSFAHPAGFGGKVDLFSSGPEYILDWKTKSFDENTKIEVYPDMYMQLSGYKYGLGLPIDCPAYNVFISTKVPGLVRVYRHEPEDHRKWLKAFNLCKDLWYTLKWDRG